ncbi:MAG: hypothetical protein E7421_03445 [Ruminococcaceae bacterium]|nr:hypothetical protein [Oscillospiraceae bacterium]
MASQTEGKKTKVTQEQAPSVIDPIYQKYTRSIIRTLSSTEFYDFFMDSIAHADNRFQFSNRKMVKTVDSRWVDAIDEALGSFQAIINNPRNVIREEEVIVNVANAKRTGTEVIQHLAQHASLVEDYNEDTGNVRPSRVMQRYREDSNEVYENRLVFTVLEHSFHFVKIRYDALFEVMGDEFGAKLKVESDMSCPTETVHVDMFLHVKETDSALDTDEKNREIFDRISRLYRMLSIFMNSPFAQQMKKLSRIKGTVVKTNIIKRNAHYRAISKLWDFLRSYDDIGYTIRIVEQNPHIDERFQRDIYHNILFQYIILKGYLEDEKDRRLPAPAKEKRRSLKPKFIHQIVEELTEDYSLPDVEVRKVLIEELTKEQLMQEEMAERRRLVEEQEQRKKAEKERLRQEKEAEKERIRKEKEAEKERIRQEKAAEEARLLQQRMERELEDRRRGGLMRREVEYFQKQLEEQLAMRAEEKNRAIKQQQDYLDAVALMEQEELRRKEEARRERIRRKEAREQAKREELLAQERARQEELARIEQERQRRLEEEARILREQQEKEARERELQRQKDLFALQNYTLELVYFDAELPKQLTARKAYRDSLRQAKLAQERKRQAKKQSAGISGE